MANYRYKLNGKALNKGGAKLPFVIFSKFMPKQTTWQKGIRKPYLPKLSKQEVCDVAIIGGGMAGVFCAYRLSKAGKSVVLLEAENLGHDATAKTTAFITQDIDTDLAELVKIFGKNRTRLIWESGKLALTNIAEIIKQEKIDCDFSFCPLNVYAKTEKDLKFLQKERLTAQAIGFETFFNKNNSLGFSNAGAWEIPRQAKFHPLKFLYALAEKSKSLGAKLYENSNVVAIERRKTGSAVKTKAAKVLCQDVIIATYDPLGNPLATKFKKGMYNSYVLEVKLPKNIIKAGLYLDTKNPYHYFRLDPFEKYDRLIIGGEDHRSELPVSQTKNFKALEDFLKKLLPKIKYTITKRWVGPILEPSDGLPLIGEVRPRQYVATAFSGNGMTYSAIAAALLTDIIAKKPNPYKELYRPARTPSLKQLWAKGKDYSQELVKGAIKNAVKY